MSTTNTVCRFEPERSTLHCCGWRAAPLVAGHTGVCPQRRVRRGTTADRGPPSREDAASPRQSHPRSISGLRGRTRASPRRPPDVVNRFGGRAPTVEWAVAVSIAGHPSTSSVDAKRPGSNSRTPRSGMEQAGASSSRQDYCRSLRIGTGLTRQFQAR